MLDQNTDRMWYVIGALVVGAGIILLANKAMPEIFASVTDMFSNVVGEGVAGIESSYDEPINYFDISQLQEGADARIYHETGRWGVYPNTYDSYILELSLKPNTKYTISTNVPIDDTPSARTIYLNTASSSGSTIRNRPVTTTTDENGYLFVGMPKNRKYTADVLNGRYWVMLNEGGEPLRYTPVNYRGGGD